MRRTRLRRLSARTLAVLTLVLAGALCWSALSVYLEGRADRDTDPSAVIFNPDAIAVRLRVLLPIFALWMAALAAALLARGISGGAARMTAPRTSGEAKPDRWFRVRAVLLGLSAVLIAIGCLNGGLRGVLIKAVNICTECIGLG